MSRYCHECGGQLAHLDNENSHGNPRECVQVLRSKLASKCDGAREELCQVLTMLGGDGPVAYMRKEPPDVIRAQILYMARELEERAAFSANEMARKLAEELWRAMGMGPRALNYLAIRVTQPAFPKDTPRYVTKVEYHVHIVSRELQRAHYVEMCRPPQGVPRPYVSRRLARQHARLVRAFFGDGFKVAVVRRRLRAHTRVVGKDQP